MILRKRINPNHPVIGEGYRLLSDTDLLEPGDETACVSMLLRIECGDKEWIPILPTWQDNLGDTVEYVCTKIGDADENDRIFRRKK